MDVMEQADVNVEAVYSCITGTFNPDSSVRSPAEAKLRTWEEDASPGFLLSLVKILEGCPDEAIRLVAAVIAKNAVGSSWRKTLGSREWSKVPDQEKAAVRSTAARLLLSEDSHRVSVQLGLLITNIARFDFPGQWPSLLSDLGGAAAWGSPMHAVAKLRMLFTLKNVLRALRSKRFVVEAPSSVAGLSPEDLKPLTDRIAQERKLMHSRTEELFPAAVDEWQQHFAAVLQGSPDWEVRGALGNRWLFVLRELLQLLPSWDNVRADVRRFLEAAQQASQASVSMIAGPEGDRRAALCAVAFERIGQCVLAALDKQPIEFAVLLPQFLRLYGHTAITAMDAAALRRVRGKTRVLLTRFLARALLCPIFSQEFIDNPPKGAATLTQREGVPKLDMEGPKAAAAALNEMMSAEQCGLLVEAIINKYIVLSAEELQEWQENPEGHVRSMDVETGPDADTPRPCGLALLLCMIERNRTPAETALVGYATRLQLSSAQISPDQGQTSLEACLAREACYRVIGEVTPLPEQINFVSWYQTELQSLLQAGNLHNGADSLQQRVLVARAAWLVGVCGGELPPPLWGEALAHLIRHMGSPDLVLALSSVSAMLSLLSVFIEQQQAIKEAGERGKDELHARMLLYLSPSAARAQDPAFIQEHKARAAVLAQHGTALLPALFALVQRLEEVESKVRVLQLVSVSIEALGDAAGPLLGSVAGALPMAWGGAADAAEGAETGAVARMHSALIAVVAHLLTRLGAQALSEAQFQSMLWRLLGHALDLSNPESDTLVEEALRLLVSVLNCTTAFMPALQELIPQLMTILRRGRDSTAVYGILEGYLLLGGVAVLQGHEATLAAALQSTLSKLLQTLMSPPQPAQPAGSPPSRPGPNGATVSPELLNEAMAAASLTDVLLKLTGEAGYSFVEPIVRGVMAVLTSPPYREDSVPQRLITLAEGLFEVVSHALFLRPPALPAMLPADAQSQSHFFDLWLTIAQISYIEEVLGHPAMASMGRMRRRMAVRSLLQLIGAQLCPLLLELKHVAQVMTVAMRALKETKQFEEDRQDVQKAVEEMQSPAEGRPQAVMLRRMQLAQADPLFSFDLAASLRTALHLACQRHSQQQVLEAVEWTDSPVSTELRAMLGDGMGDN